MDMFGDLRHQLERSPGLVNELTAEQTVPTGPTARAPPVGPNQWTVQAPVAGDIPWTPQVPTNVQIPMAYAVLPANLVASCPNAPVATPAPTAQYPTGQPQYQMAGQPHIYQPLPNMPEYYVGAPGPQFIQTPHIPMVDPHPREWVSLGFNMGDCQIQNATSSHDNGNENLRKKKSKRDDVIMLSRETISNYFYMPIDQAAKELNVGLTMLKKRCRMLGIHRWPHRKLSSLQTLINNVREIGNDGGVVMAREAIELLEREKKQVEEFPDMELEDTTKRLKRACSIAKYKRQRFMEIHYEQEYPS